ncbi:MAG: hypothetical protein ACO1OQ_05335 [Rufibacter sp.]
MRTKILLLFCLFLLLSGSSIAQDIIMKNNGEEIKVKILEITPTNISYSLADTLLQPPVFSIPRKEVFMVKYANGQKELMAPSRPEEVVLTPAQLYQLGRQDARKYYTGNGAMWASAGTTFAIGILGPIIVAAVPAKPDFSKVTNVQYLSSQDYMRGFKKQANSRKIGKAAIGFGIGVAGLVMLFSSFDGEY